MNIYCKWCKDTLLVKSGDKIIARVMFVGDEPCLTFVDGVRPSLTPPQLVELI